MMNAEELLNKVLPKNEAVLNFQQLYEKESRQLGDPVASQEKIILDFGASGEPWVQFTTKDRLGLALSGGGIRSATYNLGLLQALAQLGILKHVQYLSTVSGGGYIGGWWTAWLKRQGHAAGPEKFPLDGSHKQSSD
jgi:hypothetical protein